MRELKKIKVENFDKWYFYLDSSTSRMFEQPWQQSLDYQKTARLHKRYRIPQYDVPLNTNSNSIVSWKLLALV